MLISSASTSQNGNAELNRTAEDDDDEEEDGKEEEEDGKEEEEEQDGEAKKKKDKKRKNSQKKEKKDKKRKTPPKLAKMNDFQEDVTGDLVLSDDEERVPRQKRVYVTPLLLPSSLLFVLILTRYPSFTLLSLSSLFVSLMTYN